MCHEKVSEILNNLDTFHAAYYETETFRGPSLYFHLKALDCRNCCDAFAEASYAMLNSWGMHRMGPGGSKMKYFDVYKSSLNHIWPLVLDAARFSSKTLSEVQWKHLKEIFCGIDVMTSGTSLVGNSKIMAHALPHLIPPIDREYTLTYLYGNGNIRNDKSWEWSRLRQIVSTFFYPIIDATEFLQARKHWNVREFPWDTSPLKSADNLVIGARKHHSKGKQEPPVSP